ncbi:flagellar hook-associated protein FlgK [Persephonella atlantica]|uniref:Flagellar hook-associated protein 1 n=1 Tax=Persephonella atlantica TaxID=2699429 RepID=A0ABS1GG63_9AQUI|nr:flagellar hook-associated protein FlgK [Persephonella atlantica]MBK3331856.1 flagellar hook-associated protein FlgK [Persephonella atlantica]
MSLFFGLSLAGQSLLTHKRAMDNVNKNIANLYSEGYSRRVNHISDMVASSVYLQRIERVFDQSLFSRYINTNNQKTGYENYQDILQQIESLYNDIMGSGLSETLNDFFNSFNDVAVNPDDLAARQTVLSKATALVGRIRNDYQSLQDIKEKTGLSIKDNIQKLNNLTEQLAYVNKNIKFYFNDEVRLNEFLDERDRLLKEISSLIDTKIRINEDNTVDVFTSKGFELVLYDRNTRLTYDTDNNGNPVVRLRGINITDILNKGKIGGYLQGIKKVNEALNQLNDFTTVLALTVNKQHSSGYDLYGNTGINFFGIDPSSSLTELNASNIVVNISDPKLIAAASDPAYTNSDNTNIKKLINLKDDITGVLTATEEADLLADGLINLGGIDYRLSSTNNYNLIKEKSFHEFYSSQMVAPVSSELSKIKTLTEDSSFMLDAIDQKLKEVSSVNIDEELINLTKLQRAYEASAKIINVTDELLQTVLNLVK